jgi:hypothetical protein
MAASIVMPPIRLPARLASAPVIPMTDPFVPELQVSLRDLDLNAPDRPVPGLYARGGPPRRATAATFPSLIGYLLTAH